MTQMSKTSSSTPARPKTPRQAARRRASIDRTLDPELFKALCDPTRVRLLTCLAKCGRGCTVGEVSECCDVDLSVVSRHLALLARAGVLEQTKHGRQVSYSVRYTELASTLRAMADAIDECCPPSNDDDACCDAGCNC